MLCKHIRLYHFKNHRKQNHEVFLVKSQKSLKTGLNFAELLFCETNDIIRYYLLVKSC